MAMFGVEAILCAGVIVENGAWVELHEIVWVGARGKGWILVYAFGLSWVGVVVGLSLRFELKLG